MSLDANDPRLTAYALGELSADDLAEVEAALADSPELERAVEEIRTTGELLGRSLQDESAPALTAAQRTKIERQSIAPETAPLPKPPARRSPSKLFLLATAASLLVAVSIGAILKFAPFGESSPPMAQADYKSDIMASKSSAKYQQSADSIGDYDGDEAFREKADAAFGVQTVQGSRAAERARVETSNKLDKGGTTVYSDDIQLPSAALKRFAQGGGGEGRDGPGHNGRPAADRSIEEHNAAVDSIFKMRSRPTSPEEYERARADFLKRHRRIAKLPPEGVATARPAQKRGDGGDADDEKNSGDGDLLRAFEQDAFEPTSEDGRVLDSSVARRGLREQQLQGEVEKRLEDIRRMANEGKQQEASREAAQVLRELGEVDSPEAAKPAEAQRRFERRGELVADIAKYRELAKLSGEEAKTALRQLNREHEAKKQKRIQDALRKAKGTQKPASKTKPAKPRSWRRVKATPNASRMMIGDREELPLQGMQANVQIDGFRARVLLDYYFYNDRDRQYEGTFKLRLPNEASLYFFAFGETAYTYRPPSAEDNSDPDMRKAFFNVKDVRGAGYRPDEILKLRADTWKAPKVARIVQKEKAAFAYRETRYRKVDPALVEWSGAGVFSAKVFPLMPKKLHRIVVGYDVDLTKLGDDFVYTLDLPEGVSETAVDVNLAAVAGESAEIEPKVKPFTAGGRAYFNINRPGERVSVRIKQPGNTLLVGKDDKAGDFFAASIKADLPDDQAAVNSPYGVFLLDTSLSSNPDKFNVYLKLLREILVGNRDTLQQFAVLTFNVEAHWWEQKFVKNTPANVDRLMKYCHTLSLEGATDLSQAVREAAHPEWLLVGGEFLAKWDVFLLSDGGLNWGERNLLTLSKTLKGSFAGPVFAYHTGLSGTASRVLMHLARESGGAVFTAKGEDAIADAAKAHRKRPWQLEGVQLAGGSDLLLAGRPRTIYPGQDLLLVGRGAPAKDASVKLKVRRGEETKTLSIKFTRRIESDLAPRTYGHVATGQLESLGSLTEDMSVAYARHFRITGQTCSLLMLETDVDYKRFNIKPEDDSLLVETSLVGATIDKKISEAMTVLTNPKESFTRWLSRLEKMPGLEFHVSPALRVALDNLPPEAFEVPHSRLRAKHRTWDGTSAELKEQLSVGKVDYDMLQKEAQRRMSKYGEADAMVALSSLIENSPGNLVLIRDVAYSAIEWGLNDQAYHLLHRVAMARPYEPQMYLAMAQSLAQAGKNDLALLYYEVASSGKWNNRFRDFERIVAVDYLHFLRQIDRGDRKLALKQYAKARLDRLKGIVKLDKADLLVTVMWNTDGTDVDLHIKEPTGEVCFYQNRRTRIGGQITQDCTQGFGPELYILPNARHGKYDIQVKYFARDTSRASGRTRVLATIYEAWGTEQERVIRKAVTLTSGKEMHAIATVGIEK